MLYTIKEIEIFSLSRYLLKLKIYKRQEFTVLSAPDAHGVDVAVSNVCQAAGCVDIVYNQSDFEMHADPV